MNTSAVQDEARKLRRHLGLGESPGDPPGQTPRVNPLFFVERTPASPNGAFCKLSTCSERIQRGQYRMAVNPGMTGNKADFYHVACFEEIDDFSQADFMDRVQALTRATFSLRRLSGPQVLDGEYFCDGGAERLVLQWKVERGKWMDRRDGIEESNDENMTPAFTNLLHKAGSSEFTGDAVPNMSRFEYFTLSTMLAPIESDGPEDSNEWNLFESYIEDREDRLNDRHTLSRMLDRWQHDKKLARKDDSECNDAERQERDKLGEKAIRALKRLSVVTMPDLQGARLGLRD